MSTELAKAEIIDIEPQRIVPATPAQFMRMATDVAGVCREIVMRTAINIQGKKYIRVEGWQSIAIAHGCLASSRDVQDVGSGFNSVGEIRRMDTGITVATAEGFCGHDERYWAKRDEFARRAMAQTRSISRACRSAFAYVVVLIDANLQTTPAEEMMHMADEDPGVTAEELIHSIAEAKTKAALDDIAKQAGDLPANQRGAVRIAWRERTEQLRDEALSQAQSQSAEE